MREAYDTGMWTWTLLLVDYRERMESRRDRCQRTTSRVRFPQASWSGGPGSVRPVRKDTHSRNTRRRGGDGSMHCGEGTVLTLFLRDFKEGI